MRKFLGVFGRIVIIVLPMFLVYGILRITWLGYPLGESSLYFVEGVPYIREFNYGNFLPTWEELQETLAGYPSMVDWLTPAIEDFQKVWKLWQDWEVKDMLTFFISVGNFFYLVGSVIWLGITYIAYPFLVLGWILYGLFKPYEAPDLPDMSFVILQALHKAPLSLPHLGGLGGV